jgi:hypothetical protein
MVNMGNGGRRSRRGGRLTLRIWLLTKGLKIW